MKPCPFCGGMPHIARDRFETVRVVCGACGAQTDAHSGEGDALMAWDWRVQDGSVPPIVKAMAAATRGEEAKS